MSRVLRDLNPPQREAVTLPGGPCLVLAGAGSGKTRVLTHRAAWLVEEAGVAPWEIVAVTFTNKAAAEMRERVRRLLDASASPEIYLGTFHAWCVRLLRREAEAANLEPRFVIYDTPEQQAIVKRAMRELDIPEKDFSPSALLGRISSAKNRLTGPESFRGRGPLAEAAAEVYPRYQQILEEAGALDFDDLIMKSVLLLEGDEVVRGRYQERIRHLLVDEYQDTNHAQYRLIKAVCGLHRNLMVVGDEDQSIFSWRGADISNILEFERDFPDARVIRLEQNYRSTSRILSAALAVVSHNVQRKGKDLWTENTEGEHAILYRAADGADEAAWVVSRILQHLSGGGSLADVAIMYRTHAQSRLLEEELLRNDLPYIVLGGVRFYQRREVKDLLAYMALAVNPHDPAAFARIVNVPPRGIGRKTQEALEALARAAGLSLYQALERAVEGGAGLPARATAALKAFHTVVESLRQEARTKPPHQVVEAALRLTDYLSCFEKEPAQERQARRENVEQLITAAGEAAARGEAIPDFLAGVALQSDVDALRDEEMVPLMTLHSAKGLEFDLVFLVGLEEGLLPHANSIQEPDALEEERRLCYVGMTRARRRLHLASAATRSMRGSLRSAVPSRFLDEIPDEHMEIEDSPHLASIEWRARYQEEAHPVRRRPPSRVDDKGRSGPPTRAATQDEALSALEEYFGEKGRRAARRVRERVVDGSSMVPPRKEVTPARTAGVPGESRRYRKGDKVRHERYGAGVVLSVEPMRNDQKLTVLFSAHGRKKLLASHAPLRPLIP